MRARVIYGSVCSGIEAASVAWHPLGFTPAWFAEIEPFPSAVLAHRWPHVPNLGDFTQIGVDRGGIDILVGGTPCQSFSVAGLRGGLEDERGNLALEFIRLAERLQPRWILWENVPGVLSSSGGRDFGTFIGALEKFGYGWAYRTLDAQYFGVPQRRRRVFVVGCLGDARLAGAVLFERASMRGDPAPGRAQRKDVAGTLDARTRAGGFPGTDGAAAGHVVAHAITCHAAKGGDPTTDNYVVVHPLLEVGKRTGKSTTDIRAGLGIGSVDDPMYTLQRGAQHGVVSFHKTQTPITGDEMSPALVEPSAGGVLANAVPRRLTPRECERLQGFPDDHTLVPLPLKSRQTRVRWASDSGRYKALGNSMAVPCMRWIGRRIQIADSIIARRKAA